MSARGILIPLGAVCAVAGGLLLWVTTTRSPMPEALAALRGTSDVRVTVERGGVFEPVSGRPKVGLVI